MNQPSQNRDSLVSNIQIELAKARLNQIEKLDNTITKLQSSQGSDGIGSSLIKLTLGIDEKTSDK